MKLKWAIGAVLALGVLGVSGVQPSAAALSSKCTSPTNYQDCAGHCDTITECKKCCARGGFTDTFFDKCINRCNTVFGQFPEGP